MGGGQSTNSGSKSITQHDKAVADLKGQMAKLDRYQKQMNAKNKEEHEAIKKLLANGRRDRAMYLLKLKKIRETHVNNAQQAYMKLEELVMSIETAQINNEVLKGLQIGNESLKTLNSIMSIEAVEALLDETQEALDEQREIDALITGTLAPNFESDLEDELASLIAEETPEIKQVEVHKEQAKDPLKELEEMQPPTHVIAHPQPTGSKDKSYEDEIAELEELESLSAPSHPVAVNESVEMALAD